MDLDSLISLYLKLSEQNEHGQNTQSIAGPGLLDCEARNKLLSCNAGSVDQFQRNA